MRRVPPHGCAWCLRGAMLLRGFRLFGVPLHREPKGTKRWNVSGWTLTTRAGDAKMRLIKRLLRTGPVLLQETRWHAETHQVLHHNISSIQVAHTQGLLTERGRVSGGSAAVIPPGGNLTEQKLSYQVALSLPSFKTGILPSDSCQCIYIHKPRSLS